MLVTVLSAAGVGLLGASVQGIAAVDDDLQAATQQVRQHDVTRDGDKRDCPKPRSSRRPSLKS